MKYIGMDIERIDGAEEAFELCWVFLSLNRFSVLQHALKD